jgi:hypothetical protein
MHFFSISPLPVSNIGSYYLHNFKLLPNKRFHPTPLCGVDAAAILAFRSDRT